MQLVIIGALLISMLLTPNIPDDELPQLQKDLRKVELACILAFTVEAALYIAGWGVGGWVERDPLGTITP